MVNSPRFEKLKIRVASIANSFLPEENTNGDYSTEDQDNMRAYLLLVHAEIESYFEEVSHAKAHTAFVNWKNNRTNSAVLLSLVSFCENAIKEKELEDRINQALTLYLGKLKKNNGIKEEDLLDILLPVGLEKKNIDSAWLNTMTSFGKQRGAIAHTSSTVQQSLDPKNLKQTVDLIMEEITKIDLELEKIS